MIGVANRTAIVTGAESGIGKATAIALAEVGYDIGFTWVTSPDAANATVEELGARAVRVAQRRLDLSTPEAGSATMEELINELGAVDALVNNAATGYSASFLDTPVPDWRRVLDINLTGQFACAQAVARWMVTAGRPGAIVNVTSVQESLPVSNSSAYGAAKGGLRQLTRVMAVELGPHRIRVNAVAPGQINTAMNNREGVPATDVVHALLPLGRAGSPQEVAAAIVWLVSDAAAYLTGVSIVVDGGAVLLGPELALRD